MIIVTCKDCGKSFQTEDLSDILGCSADTCNECYDKIQDAAIAAAKQVRAEYEAARVNDIESEI